jgi:hypothetical protein
MTVTVTIPMTLPSVANGNKGGHWAVRARRTKAQRASVGLMLRANTVALRLAGSHGMQLPGLICTLTRVSPRALDSDNLAFAFKAVRDEVAAYFGVDDADPRVEWRYEQAKGKACVRIAFDVVAQRVAS